MRPPCVINYGHPYARNLVFAWVGSLQNSKFLYDAALNKTLTGSAALASDFTWGIMPGWNRECFVSDSATKHFTSDSTPLVGATHVTMSCVVNHITAGGGGCPVYCQNSAGGAGAAIMYVSPKLFFRVEGEYIGLDGAEDGDSHHIAGTYSPSSTKGYVDGVLTDSDNDARTLPTSATVKFFQGETYNWRGSLADVFIWTEEHEPSFIQRFADPSNLYYDGLLVPVHSVLPIPPVTYDDGGGGGGTPVHLPLSNPIHNRLVGYSNLVH